jgi:hypothetical protein
MGTFKTFEEIEAWQQARMRPLTLCSVCCLLYSVCFAQWEPEVRLTYDGDPTRIWANNGWCLAATASGTLQAVWWEGRDGNAEVYGKRSTDNGATWLPDQNLSNDADTSWCQSLAVSDSTIHLVYKDRHGGWGVFYRRSTDAGATWLPDTVLAREASPIGGCMTDAASDSLVHVMWSAFRGSNSEAYYRRSTDCGLTWLTEQRISFDSARSEDPAVAASDSFVHVVWFDTRAGSGDPFYRRSTDNGATWGPETRLSNDTAFSYAPTLAVADSFVHVAWIDRRHGPFQTYYKRSADFGATWGPDVRIADNTGGCLFPVLAASGLNVHIAWYDNRTGNNQIYYRNSTDGGLNWTPELRLTQTSTNSANPATALTGDAVHVVFCDDRSGDTELYYLRNPTGNVGVAQTMNDERGTMNVGPTIVRSVLLLPPSLLTANSSLLSIDGGKVLDLRPGPNSLSRLSPGVYFVREWLAVSGGRSAVGVRKVLITR